MTYIIRRTADDSYSLEDSNGNVVTTLNGPELNLPDDIIDAILDDMGVGAPQAEAFKVLFKGDWEIVDDR